MGAAPGRLFAATSAASVTGLLADTGTYWSGSGQAVSPLPIQQVAVLGLGRCGATAGYG